MPKKMLSNLKCIFAICLAFLIVFSLITPSVKAVNKDRGLWQETLRIESKEYTFEAFGIALKLAYSIDSEISYPLLTSSDLTKIDVSLRGGKLDLFLKYLPLNLEGHLPIDVPLGKEVTHTFFNIIKVSVKLVDKVSAYVSTSSSPLEKIFENEGTKSFEISLRGDSTGVKVKFTPMINLKVDTPFGLLSHAFKLGDFPQYFTTSYKRVLITVSQPIKTRVSIGKITKEVDKDSALKVFAVPGSYRLSAQKIISISPSERYVFEKWTGDLTDNSHSVTIGIKSPTSIVANYKRQYLVQVFSERGSKGTISNWFDEGDILNLNNISIQNRVQEGLIIYVLKGFIDEDTGSKISGSILIKKPLRLRAIWQPDYSLLITVILISVAAVIIIAILLVRRRRRALSRVYERLPRSEEESIEWEEEVEW